MEDLIDYMNDLIKSNRNPYFRASFRNFLIYLGVEEEDDILKTLKSHKKRATALTSQRILGDKVISKKDLKILYDSVDEEWKLVIGMLYDTACRKSELLNIRWKDITFKQDGNIFAQVIVLGKGKKLRTVYLTEQTVKLLKKLRIGLKETDKIFEFYNLNNELYINQGKYLLKKIKAMTKKYIGKEYVVHSFRHSKSFNLANNGANVVGISNLLGHSNFSTTQIYIKNSNTLGKKMYEDYSESIGE